jgi:N-formylmaleamate deformylase
MSFYGAHVHANGIRLHYLRYYDSEQPRPPLIVVPGITSPAATWDFVGERLGRKFDTYILDVRGRGLSSAGPDLDHGLDTYAVDVAEFARALGLQRFHLLGHSLGARTAARFARRFGGMIDRLVLADPPLSGPGRRPYVKSLAFYNDAINQALQGRLTFEEMRLTYPGWGERQLRSRVEWLHTCDLHAIAACHRGLQEEEIHSDFPHVSVPTLLLAAEKGGVISDDDLIEIRRLMPMIQTARLAGAGHMLPFDDLDGFVDIVERFFG